MTRPPLRAVDQSEDPPAGTPGPGGGGNGGSSLGQRLARVEGKLEHIATREDVSEVKALIKEEISSMLKWLLGIMALAAISVLAALLRTFLP